MAIRNCCQNPELRLLMGGESTGLYAIESTYKSDTKTLAIADGKAEAEQAKRAFENVLAPRFTRDEAIAIVKEHRGADAVLTVEPMTNARREYIAGMRAALEALAAAGAFVPAHPLEAVVTTAELLDAAGIK